MSQINLIFILLIVFQLKHLVADYFLQGKFMIGKFKPGWDFFLPLLAHVTIHGLFTSAICLAVKPELWWLAAIDMIIHFFMDRIKAGPKYLGQFKPLTGDQYKECMKTRFNDRFIKSENRFMTPVEAFTKLKHNTFFWFSLGFDAMVHHLTHYFIIWILVC